MPIASVFASNLGSVGIAFVSKNSLVMEASRLWFDTPRFFYAWLCFSWFLGFLFATFLVSSGRVGAYRGLYCCVKDTTDPATTIPMLLFFVVCASVMQWFYQSLRAYVKDQDDFVIEAVTLHAWRMSSIYYVAWAFCALMGLLAVAKGDLNYPLWLDIIAVLAIKVGPILNCIVAERALTKAEDYERKKHAANNNGSRESEQPIMDESRKRKNSSSPGVASTPRSDYVPRRIPYAATPSKASHTLADGIRPTLMEGASSGEEGRVTSDNEQE